MLLSGIVASSKVPKLAKIYSKSGQNFGLKFREILMSFFTKQKFYICRFIEIIQLSIIESILIKFDQFLGNFDYFAKIMLTSSYANRQVKQH